MANPMTKAAREGGLFVVYKPLMQEVWRGGFPDSSPVGLA